jgi:hypothetical protein
MPLIVDGTTKYRPGETNRQSLTFTHTAVDVFDNSKYSGTFTEFNSDITPYEIVPGYSYNVSESYASMNILRTNGNAIAYGSFLNPIDASVRGKTETQGGGAGGLFEVTGNHDGAYLLPYNSAVKGVYSSATNSGTGSTVGYFGYGYGQGLEGTSVGVCGYGTRASSNLVYTCGI